MKAQDGAPSLVPDTGNFCRLDEATGAPKDKGSDEEGNLYT